MFAYLLLHLLLAQLNLFQVTQNQHSLLQHLNKHNERTTCALGSHTSVGPINSTNACYAGYYDQILTLCYGFHTCDKYNPIKPIGCPTSSIPLLPPSPIGKSTSLVFDSYFGQDSSKGKRMHMLTRPVVIPLHMIHVHIRIHPIHLTARDIMRHHEAYYFNWNNTVSKSW